MIHYNGDLRGWQPELSIKTDLGLVGPLLGRAGIEMLVS
jgi:hypothetical protein